MAEYVEELVAKKVARPRPDHRPRYNSMDDLRFSIVDIAEEAGSQETIRDQQLCATAGDGFRFDHAGLQHALHLLHRPADARRGA